MEVNSFKIKELEIYVLEEEIELFKDIYEDLFNILKKINPQINFIRINKSFSNFKPNIKILTILPPDDVKNKKYYPLFVDRGDMTGRFNFYKEFLENNNFSFEISKFFKAVEKLRYNWTNSTKKERIKNVNIVSKLSNFKNKVGFKNFKRLFKFIKLKFLIKYNLGYI